MEEFALAFAGTAALLAPTAVALRWRQVLDVPTERSSHTAPVLRGGGLACLGGATLGVTVGALRGGEARLWQLGLLVLALAVVGLADDLFSVPVGPRLLAQLAVGTAAGWLVHGDVGWLALGAVAVVVSTNAVNFMDGINGITGLSIGVWGASAMLAAHRQHDHTLFVLAAVASGAAIGFLPANLPTARLFLGDVGSYLFGALVGVGILVGVRHHADLRLLLAPLALYATDTAFTLGRRIRRREPFLRAHRDHVYQRLVWSRGHSHTTVAFAVATLSVLIVISWDVLPPAVAAPVSGLLLAGYLAAPWLERVAGSRAVQRGSHA